jgi:N-sulfoglucosamine sulfohydrolase
MYYPMRAVRGRKYKYVWNLAAGLPFPFASDLHASATWQAVLRGKLDRYGKRAVATFLQRPAHELYDLEADPDETVNLAGDPARRDVLDELQAKLKAWQQATGDPWRIKHEHE